MSRTLHVDLTPSRRSKRLLKNGYYVQPPGEQMQPCEASSEEDDDNASIHSNASSIYSERAVHYSEGPNSPLFRKRRRRRDFIDSPVRTSRQGSPWGRNNPNSPARKKSFIHGDGSVAKGSPSLLVFKRDSLFPSISDHMRVAKESKSVTSIRHTSHRESEAVFAESETYFQNADHATAPLEQRDTVMNKNRYRYDAIGAGDQVEIHGSAETVDFSAELFSTPSVSVRAISTRQQSSRNFEETLQANRAVRARKYSSECDLDDENVVPKQSRPLESAGSLFPTQMARIVWLFYSWLSASIGYVCGMVYQMTLLVFEFDVRLLSRRSGPVLAKVARYVLLFLLLLVLLSAIYLFATRFVTDSRHTALLPLHSLVGLFQVLSQKISSFASFTERQYNVVHPTTFKQDQAETPSPQMSSHEEFQAMLQKMKSHFTEQLSEMKNEISKIREEQTGYSAKQQELSQAQRQAMQKLLSLKTQMEESYASHSDAGSAVKSDIEELRALLSDKSQTVLIGEFNDRLSAFHEKLNVLDGFMTKSVKRLEQHTANTTYIKEIARLQFIESFFNVLETTEGSTEERSKLHMLFVAWLSKQGFAKVQEVDENLRQLVANQNLAVTDLERKFTTRFERIRHEAKRRSSIITVEKVVERVVERPVKHAETAGSSIAVEADVRRWMRDELALYSADRIGVFDHALETAGGSIVSTRCSRSYTRKTALISVFGLPIYYDTSTPRMLLQPGTLPGECWAFEGSEGYVVIGTSSAVRPTSFAMDHIPKELSPYGRLDSAPKDFKVLALTGERDYEGVVLGEFRYEEDGPIVQQFAVTADNKEYFRHFELRITSNWGHPEYTCVYRFRVHGDMQEDVPSG